MRKIKFRYKDADGYPYYKELNLPKDTAQYICDDADGAEVYEKDALEVDFDGLQEFVGEGFMAQDLLAVRPNKNAELKFFYERGRYRLYWTLPNGRTDTGMDYWHVAPVMKFFRVKARA